MQTIEAVDQTRLLQIDAAIVACVKRRLHLSQVDLIRLAIEHLHYVTRIIVAHDAIVGRIASLVERGYIKDESMPSANGEVVVYFDYIS